MNRNQLKELILQSLEHERGGVEVYETAVECAVNDDLREEWSEYLAQTRKHVQILEASAGSSSRSREASPAGRSFTTSAPRSSPR